jgi:hypothetical protein
VARFWAEFRPILTRFWADLGMIWYRFRDELGPMWGLNMSIFLSQFWGQFGEGFLADFDVEFGPVLRLILSQF